jgi:branched-chain amino acid transport system permease protein
MFQQTTAKTATMIVLLLGLVAYALAAGSYGRELVAEASGLMILAIGLDLVAGYGGMISLCHGAIYGIGAYVFTVLTGRYGINPWLALPAACLGGAVFGYFVGAVTSRIKGIFFIMATLAFGEMVHLFVFDNRWLGGDDGLTVAGRLDLSALGIDLSDSLSFALASIVIAALCYVLAALVLRSGFGRTLVGIRSNEPRMRALGLTVWRHKAAAFAMSGAGAALAGTIAAQQTMFVSPTMMTWMTSGDALVAVILGGLGTLAGPAVGAVLVVLLEHQLSSLTRYWHLIMGLVLIAVVVLGNRGLYGQLEHWLERRRRPAQPALSAVEKRERQHA